MTLATERVLALAADMNAIVARSRSPDALPDVAEQLAAALRRLDIPVDRLQLPLSFLFGFKHPFYAGIVLTWTPEDGSSAWFRQRRPDQLEEAKATLRRSPFAPVALDGEPCVHLRDTDPRWGRYPLLNQLGREGYTDYVAVAAPLADGARQVVSVATRATGGFADDVTDLLQSIAPVLSLGLYGLYQALTAFHVATTYLGPRTGARVIGGEMGRGASETVSAVIAFIDIRGFTGLCDRIGVGAVVPLLNATFDTIDHHLSAVGGEILKLMGDAALVMFPRDTADSVDCIDIVSALLDTIDAVRDETTALGHPLDIAIGLHIGDVMYGNVGSAQRHDFTVMGPAVNLAARLEMVSKRLEMSVVVSDAFARTCGADGIDAAGRLNAWVVRYHDQAVAGLGGPIVVWGIDRMHDGSTPPRPRPAFL